MQLTSVTFDQPLDARLGPRVVINLAFLRAQFRAWEWRNVTLASGLITHGPRSPDLKDVLRFDVWGDPAGPFLPLPALRADATELLPFSFNGQDSDAVYDGRVRMGCKSHRTISPSIWASNQSMDGAVRAAEEAAGRQVFEARVGSDKDLRATATFALLPSQAEKTFHPRAPCQHMALLHCHSC